MHDTPNADLRPRFWPYRRSAWLINARRNAMAGMQAGYGIFALISRALNFIY